MSWDMDFLDLELRKLPHAPSERKPCPGTWISWIWRFGNALARRRKENHVLGHRFPGFEAAGAPRRAVGKKTVSWDMVFLDLELREGLWNAVGKKNVSWDIVFLDLKLRERPGAP